MNITKAYLFQEIEKPRNVTMVWENGAITDMFNMVNAGLYRYIGYVNYDTVDHRLVG